MANLIGDPTYRFYNGCSLAFEGRNQEAIRELERCTNEHDLSLGTVLALLYCHKRCQVVDREAIEMLENRLVKVKEESNDVVKFCFQLFYFRFYTNLPCFHPLVTFLWWIVSFIIEGFLSSSRIY